MVGFHYCRCECNDDCYIAIAHFNIRRNNDDSAGSFRVKIFRLVISSVCAQSNPIDFVRYYFTCILFLSRSALPYFSTRRPEISTQFRNTAFLSGCFFVCETFYHTVFIQRQVFRGEEKCTRRCSVEIYEDSV